MLGEEVLRSLRELGSRPFVELCHGIEQRSATEKRFQIGSHPLAILGPFVGCVVQRDNVYGDVHVKMTLITPSLGS